jgi:hypothetical protein
MGIDLNGKLGDHFHMSWSAWGYCLETAYRHGWRPLGTVAADPAFLEAIHRPGLRPFDSWSCLELRHQQTRKMKMGAEIYLNSSCLR